MARNPDHPQAPHLYIHLMENGPDPKRAEAAADRLAAPLAPRRRPPRPHAGAHLLPARALEGFDPRQHRRRARGRGLYPGSRTTRASSATAIIRTTSTSSSPRRRWAGDLPTAIREARRLAGSSTRRPRRRSPGSRRSTPRLISPPRNSPRRRRVLAMAGARSAAALCPGRCATMPARWPMPSSATSAASTRRLAALEATPPVRRAEADGRPGHARARPAAAGRDMSRAARFASLRGRHLQAARHYRQAIAIEDTHPLHGAALVVLSGQPVARRGALPRRALSTRRSEAFTAALAKSPNNGWALYGLAASERALGRRAHAAAARRRSTAPGWAIRSG